MSLVKYMAEKSVPKTYNGNQVMKILNISKPTVKFRAEKLGIKKQGLHWKFSDFQVEMMKNYKYERPVSFKFSDDGEFLIISSKLNKMI